MGRLLERTCPPHAHFYLVAHDQTAELEDSRMVREALTVVATPIRPWHSLCKPHCRTVGGTEPGCNRGAPFPLEASVSSSSEQRPGDKPLLGGFLLSLFTNYVPQGLRRSACGGPFEGSIPLLKNKLQRKREKGVTEMGRR